MCTHRGEARLGSELYNTILYIWSCVCTRYCVVFVQEKAKLLQLLQQPVNRKENIELD